MARRDEQPKWNETHARRELEAWERSGESMAEFARRHGYPAGRLSWWKRRLALQHQETPTETAMVRLAPAIITGIPEARGASVVVTIDAAQVRVEIDTPEAVHPAWVAELAHAVRRGASV